MMFWPTHFSGVVTVTSAPVIIGLTDGVAATGTVLGVSLAGQTPTGTIQWLRNGTPIAGATAATLAVPAFPGDQITVVVDGVGSGAVTIVETLTVAFSFTGAVLNPGDQITVTANGAIASAGEVQLTRDGQPLPLGGGQYIVTTADLGRALDARQSNLPSNTAGAVTVMATPVPVLVSAPGNSGGTEEGQTRSVDMTDSWQADGAPATIILREYRLLVGGVAGPAQASPVLTLPAGSAGQTAQPQLRARTATSALSAWEDAGSAFTIAAGDSWSITDNGNGTFSIITTPGRASAPVVIDNGDGSFDIAA